MMENTNENYQPSRFRRTKNLALVITTSAALAFAGCSPEYKETPRVETKQPAAGAETFYPANTNAEVQLEDFTPVDSLEHKTNEVAGVVSTNTIAQNYGRTTNSTRSGGSVLPLLMHRTVNNSGSSQSSSYGSGLKSDYGSSVRNTYDAAPAAEHSAVTKSSSVSSSADADGSSVSKGSSTASKSTVTRGGFGSSGSHHAGGTGS